MRKIDRLWLLRFEKKSTPAPADSDFDSDWRLHSTVQKRHRGHIFSTNFSVKWTKPCELQTDLNFGSCGSIFNWTELSKRIGGSELNWSQINWTWTVNYQKLTNCFGPGTNHYEACIMQQMDAFIEILSVCFVYLKQDSLRQHDNLIHNCTLHLHRKILFSTGFDFFA